MAKKLLINEPETMHRDTYQHIADRILDHRFNSKEALTTVFLLWDECQAQMTEVDRLEEMLRGEDD